MTLSKKDKIFLGCLIVTIIVVWIFSLKGVGGMDNLKNMGIGSKWIYTLPGQEPGFSTRINFMTVGIGGIIVITLILIATVIGKKFSLIPDRKQSFFELLFDFMYTAVEDGINDKKYVRPIFTVAMTLFLFISVSNILSGVPGLSVSVIDGKPVFSLFMDTWVVPTSDINTNGTFALVVLLLSHAFGIKVKGFKTWAKAFFEPSPILFPLNLIGELAKPVSMSCRLFGNIFGGGLLVLILSYVLKYLFLPIPMWGFFAIFLGILQALIFSILAVVNIGLQIN